MKNQAARRSITTRSTGGRRSPAGGWALTGSNFTVRTWLYAERRAARVNEKSGGAPVYHYSLDWGSPFAGGRMGAHHAMDLPFVFDTTETPLSTQGADGAPELAAAMSATWAAFP